MTDEATERRKDPHGPVWKRPWFLLSQLASGISLVKLLQDLDWVSLKGVIAEWVAFYNMMVVAVVGFLTGWIQVSWMRISEHEAHALVVISFAMAMMSKSLFPDRPQKTDRYRVSKRFFSLALWPGTPLLMMLNYLFIDYPVQSSRGLLLIVGLTGLFDLAVAWLFAERVARRVVILHMGSVLGWAAAIIVVGNFLLR
ncbi:hypothetical protein [Allorhizocola rhizosphaerae]|uniref:hypothetical protein n=1 Tax=Allorhizocola rhizosphaerae TaxID=1872709 RepID=UPI000E3C4335|nr:hypothetical protein [Allorhizocola rhizosphaerae]